MINRLYTYYCVAVAVWWYVVFYPLQLAFLMFRRTYSLADGINNVVLRLVFFFWGIRFWVKGREKFQKGESYVVVANHASFLDIPMMFFAHPGYGIFVGKSSLQKIPLFGYMYKKLYILVNRREHKSRSAVYERGKKVLAEGRSVIIFPEGTIPNKNIPKMLPFKEGAFRLAIESGKPIIPVTILDSWKIMEDKKPMRIKKHSFAAIVHDPVDTSQMGEEDIDNLRRYVYNLIDDELMRWEEKKGDKYAMFKK